jgi:hypothetical protein
VQIFDTQTDTTLLANLGAEAVRLLVSGAFEALASRYGYASVSDALMTSSAA